MHVELVQRSVTVQTTGVNTHVKLAVQLPIMQLFVAWQSESTLHCLVPGGKLQSAPVYPVSQTHSPEVELQVPVEEQPSPPVDPPQGGAVGASVGASVGSAVGDAVGASVGSSVGAAVGRAVGAAVGASVGSAVGASVGASVVGAADGSAVGDGVG